MKNWWQSKIVGLAAVGLLTVWGGYFNGNMDVKSAIGGSLIAVATAISRVWFTDTKIVK